MTSLFPFPQIRSGQKELMRDIETVLETGSTLMAHAPTGIGKTAAALTPALEYALNNDKIIFFLTSKQSQHKIVIETLRLMKEKIKDKDLGFSVVDIISKQAMCPRDIAKEYYAVFNEMCMHEQKNKKCRYFRSDKEMRDKILSNILHVEELKDLCAENIICPHRTALEAVAEADVVVCDYNYIFTDIIEKVLDKTQRPLDDIILIVDEAHNLPDRIRNHLSGELTLNMIDDAAKDVMPVDKRLHRHLKDIGRFFDKFIEKSPGNTEINVGREEITKGIEEALQDVLGSGMSYMEFLQELIECEVKIAEKEDREKKEKEKSPLTSVIEFLENWNTKHPCSRVYDPEVTPTLRFKLLDPSVMSEGILSGVHASVLMSGTLYPVEMYADILGAKNALLRQYKSPFPAENKLVLITKKLTTLYSMRGDLMYNEIAKKISKIHDAVNGNVAAFFPSYSLMDAVYEKFEYAPDVDIGDKLDDIILEQRRMSKSAKNKLFNKLKINTNKILMGVQAGSLSEGIDYKHNILRAVIIVGLPLSPPVLEVKNLRDYYIKKFGKDKGMLYGYIYPAISKVLQAAGRGIRSENDVGAVILMDYRFAYGKYRECLPPDYDIKITSEAEELCGEFFKKDFVLKALEETEKRLKEEKEKQKEEIMEIEKEKEIEKEINLISDKNLIPLKILECVYEFNEKLGKHKIAGVLTGSKAKFVEQGRYNEGKNYGILGNFTAKDIAAVIDELLQRYYLEQAGDFLRPTVKISRKGGVAVLKKEEIELETLSQIKEPKEKKPKEKEPKEKKQKEESEEPLTQEEMKLFEKLRNWRRTLADKHNVPPYTIFHDKTLREVARKKPRIKEDLKDIYGVGDAKLKKYGGVLIGIVNSIK